MPCPKCGAINNPKAHFCTQCGTALDLPVTRLQATCPNCDVPLRPGVNFCPACGHALHKPDQPIPDPEAGDEAIGDQRITVQWPGGHTEEHSLSQSIVLIGRAPDNDIVLNFSTVSGYHARLDVTPDHVNIVDLHSTNGTQLKGERISPGKPYLWRPGETIRVGDFWGNSISMALKIGAGPAPALHTEALGMHHLRQHDSILIGRDHANQITLDHPTVSRRHAEIAREMVPGAVALGQTRRAIRDLGSVNGTFVNGQRVTSWMPLRMGDVIRIGPYKMVYDGEEEKLATSISQGHRLDAIGLGVQVSGGRMILQEITLTVEGGEFIALVGGSGAGKSTLMKAMNGFRPASHGRMFIDGELLYPNLGSYRTLMGYVPQDDIIHKILPVRQALWYSARLRLPDATPAEIEARIQDVLAMVDMTHHADKPVRVLSGGQRKRVSIAVELLAEPDMLFLDEPTSGLDPGLEKKMMYDLNRLADQGRTVVLITHATANIEQCDHVGFLERGNLAYYGPPKDAISFFQAQDFADIYLKLADDIDLAGGKQPPAELQPYVPAAQTRAARLAGQGQPVGHFSAGLLWTEKYNHSPLHQHYVADRQASLGREAQLHQTPAPAKPGGTKDSVLRQLLILAQRQIALIRHDLRTLFILLLMMPLIAFLFMLVSDKSALVGRPVTEASLTQALLDELGADSEDDLNGKVVGRKASYLPLQDAANLVTMLGLALTQAGTFGAAYEIVKERAIFRREKSVNLRVSAYVLSKAVILGFFAVIQVASVLIILALKVDLGFDAIMGIFPAGVLELFVTLLIAVFASIMLGLFISAAVPSPDVVLYIILIQLFTQIILSGTLFPLENNPVSKLVISYWTMDAMGATVDLNRLNEESLVCQVGEQDVTTAQGTETYRAIGCDSAAVDELELPYDHTPRHLVTTWAALGMQALIWGAATMWVQSKVKGD